MTGPQPQAVRAGNRAYGRVDALWLLGSALAALIICAGTMTGILYLERPAQTVVVRQSTCTAN